MNKAITDDSSCRPHTDLVAIADPAEADVHGDTIRQGVLQADFTGEAPIPPFHWHIIRLCDMYTCIHVMSIRDTHRRPCCIDTPHIHACGVIPAMHTAVDTQLTGHDTDG